MSGSGKKAGSSSVSQDVQDIIDDIRGLTPNGQKQIRKSFGWTEQAVAMTPQGQTVGSVLAQTPGEIYKYLKENTYGEPSRGTAGIYIMVCIDFLDEQEMRRIALEWKKYFLTKTGAPAMPEKYQVEEPGWDKICHRIYKAGRTETMGIDRHFKSAKTISAVPPNMDMWLYHTWVTFNNSEGGNMQADVEAMFLRRLKDWRMSSTVKHGQTEMVLGCSLEDNATDSLQYIVHSSVLEVIKLRAKQATASAAEFEWKDNGTNPGGLFNRRSRRFIGNGGQKEIPKFTMNSVPGKIIRWQKAPRANQRDVPVHEPAYNPAMQEIIDNAQAALDRYDYLWMYKWLEHLDIDYQRFPDYDYEDDKTRLRQEMVYQALDQYEKDHKMESLAKIDRWEMAQKGVVHEKYLERIAELTGQLDEANDKLGIQQIALEENEMLRQENERLKQQQAQLQSTRSKSPRFNKLKF
jgi:hypothetical protein